MKHCSEATDEILGRIGLIKNNGKIRSNLDKSRVVWFYDAEASKLLEGTISWNHGDVSKRCIHALFIGGLRRALDYIKEKAPAPNPAGG